MGYDRPYYGEIPYVTQKGIISPTRHHLYVTWRMMNVRCYDERHKAYHRYGARGVTVCVEWRWDNEYGFLNFINCMGERPIGHTLDRIDNDWIYHPDNCKWSTKKEQQNNIGIGLRNTSGELGVMFNTHSNSWVVVVTLNGEPYRAGVFNPEDKELAIELASRIRKIKNEQGDDAAIKECNKLKKTTPKGKRVRRNKTSQYYGVSSYKDTGRWRAFTNERFDGKLRQVGLGIHDTEEEAYQAVLDRMRLTGELNKED